RAALHARTLCDQAPLCLLAAAAAWGRGQTLVLPPDRLARTVERMHARFADAYCLCDTPEVARFAQRQGMGVFDIQYGVRADRLPPPEITSSLSAAVLFTSGSTGATKR